MAKKIGAIISLSLIGILIIATIIMANIKVDYSINCEKPDHVYVNNIEKVEHSDKIIELINNASNQNSLYALFNGSLNNEAVVKTSNKSTINSTSNYLVTFVYNEPQKLMQGNKEYEDAKGKKYTYNSLVFDVKNNDGEAEVKVYVIADRNSEPNTYTHYYLLQADFTELYSYLKQNF